MFLRKLKNKLRSLALVFLIQFSLAINSPTLTAFVLAVSARKINSLGRLTVLCMRRSIFIADVQAIARWSGQIKCVIIEREHLRLVLYHFLTRVERETISETNYYTSNIGQAGKQRYYAYLNKMFPTLKKFINFEAGLAGNFGYIEQQELARIFLEKNIPFFVLHKEGLTFAGVDQATANEYVKIYKTFKFIGSKMLFYNQQIFQALVNLGIPGLNQDQAVVVGIPRMDNYFNSAGTDQPSNQVVLFSFYPSDKFFNFSGEAGGKKLATIKDIAYNFHLWLMRFAANNPKIKVVIKTKYAQQYLDYVTDIFNKNFRKKINNLVITNLGDASKLIKDSRVVLGFKSTTLLEGIIANRFIISPYFGDIIPNDALDYFTKYPELVKYAKTEKELSEWILQTDRYLDYNQESKNKFLTDLIYLPDGRASLRTEQAIINTIKNNK